MRILHLYKDYAPVVGGIENHVRVLAEHQAAQGHEVGVLAFALGVRGSTSVEDDVRVIRASRLATVASMPLGATYPILLWRERPDIIHIHVPFPLGVASELLAGHSQATVITYHSDIIRQKRLLRLYGPVLRRGLRSADRIIATSPVYRDSSPWLKPVLSSCRVVPLGIDPGVFSPASTPASAGKFLFVGKFRHYKGLLDLLHVAEHMPEARFTLAGDGPDHAAIAALVAARGLGGRVSLPGFVPDADLPDLYRQHSAFVLPAISRAEAFGTVLLEAMASGLPVVTTEVGSGSTWVVQDGSTGLVVPAGSPSELAAACVRLAADPAASLAMGALGRARVLEHFTLGAMTDGVMAVYEEALDLRG